MNKGIAEINVSDSDELRLKKINDNFKNIVLGATPVGAVSTVGGGYVRMATAVGGSISTNPQFASSLSNYLITAKYITADKIGVKDLLVGYADIELANIGDLAANNIWTKTLQASEVMGEDGYFSQVLDAVKIRTSNLLAGSITADKLVLSSGVVNIQNFIDTTIGLFDIINKSVLNSQGIDVSTRINQIMTSQGINESDAVTLFDSGIDGSALIVGSVTASKITVSDLVAFHAKIGGFYIDDPEDSVGGLYANLAGGGKFEMRPDGYFRAGNVDTYIEVDPHNDNGKLDIHCTTMHTEEDMTIASHWKWDFVPQTGALNLLYIGA